MMAVNKINFMFVERLKINNTIFPVISNIKNKVQSLRKHTTVLILLTAMLVKSQARAQNGSGLVESESKKHLIDAGGFIWGEGGKKINNIYIGYGREAFSSKTGDRFFYTGGYCYRSWFQPPWRKDFIDEYGIKNYGVHHFANVGLKFRINRNRNFLGFYSGIYLSYLRRESNLGWSSISPGNPVYWYNKEEGGGVTAPFSIHFFDNKTVSFYIETDVGYGFVKEESKRTLLHGQTIYKSYGSKKGLFGSRNFILLSVSIKL